MTEEELAALGLGTYRDIRRLEHGPHAGHYAHLAPMMFTVGVMVSHRDHGNPLTRWCYRSAWEAHKALNEWTGEGDPPGHWIKQKGRLADGRAGERNRVPGPFDNPDGTPKR